MLTHKNGTKHFKTLFMTLTMLIGTFSFIHYITRGPCYTFLHQGLRPDNTISLENVTILRGDHFVCV